MPDAHLIAASAGFWGKLPAHGDFVRRGIGAGLARAVDAWLETAIAALAEPDAWLAGFAPRRFATTALAPGSLVVGALAPSRDSVGRDWPLAALRLLPAGPALPAAPTGSWDDWATRAESLAAAAVRETWTADALGLALAAAARADVLAMGTSAPFEVAAAGPATLVWDGGRGGRGAVLIEGLPTGDAFAALFAGVAA